MTKKFAEQTVTSGMPESKITMKITDFLKEIRQNAARGQLQGNKPSTEHAKKVGAA